jgi:hypothetical protein
VLKFKLPIHPMPINLPNVVHSSSSSKWAGLPNSI